VSQTLFGNLEEARDRMAEMSRQYFGVDHNDLRDKQMSMRMLFDKVTAHLRELANDEEKQREFQGTGSVRACLTTTGVMNNMAVCVLCGDRAKQEQLHANL